MKFKDYIKENKTSDYVEKFGMKMGGSTFETAVGWVDGINVSTKQKKEILRSIIKKYNIKPKGPRNLRGVEKNYPWAKEIVQ